MIIYVLIMSMVGAIHTHEFNNLEDCEKAGMAFYENSPSGRVSRWSCVEKRK